MKKQLYMLVAALVILSIMLTACGATPEPQVIIQTVEVEKQVTVEVEKEVLVEVTKIVEGSPVVEVVTATPAPVEELPYGLKPGKPYAGTTITVLITGIVPQYQWLMNESPRFTEMTGIEVKYETVPWASLVEKITIDGIARAGAFDLYPYLDAWGPSISQFMLPIDDLMKKSGIDWSDFAPAHRAGSCYADGQCYGIPLRGHPQILFYRKDVFDQLGLKPPTTFMELEEVSKVIQENTDLYGFSLCYGAGFGNQSLMTWVPFLWGNGSDIFDENWKPIFNNAAGVEATQRHVDLLLKHEIVPPASVTWGEAAMANSIRQGESAMMMSWWWILQTFSDPALTGDDVLDKVGFAPPPGWEEKESVPYTLVMPIGINRFSKNPEAAWEYIKMMTSAEAEKVRVTDKSDPATSDIVAVHLSVLLDAEVNAINGGIHLAAYESFKVSRIMPMIPEWNEVAAVLETAIQQMATGAPVQATLDAAAKDVTGIMERAGYYD